MLDSVFIDVQAQQLHLIGQRPLGKTPLFSKLGDLLSAQVVFYAILASVIDIY